MVPGLLRELKVWGLGGLGVLGFRVWGLGFRVWGSGFRVWGSGFRICCLGFRGFGFRVEGFRT